jgi:hypothetical protein
MAMVHPCIHTIDAPLQSRLAISCASSGQRDDVAAGSSDGEKAFLKSGFGDFASPGHAFTKHETAID